MVKYKLQDQSGNYDSRTFRTFLGNTNPPNLSSEVFSGDDMPTSGTVYLTFVLMDDYVFQEIEPNVVEIRWDDYRQGEPYLFVGNRVSSTNLVNGGELDGKPMVSRSVSGYFRNNATVEDDFHIQVPLSPTPPVLPTGEVETVTFTRDVAIPFETTTIELADKPVGYENIVSEGVNGLKELGVEQDFQGDTPVGEERIISETILVEPINRVREVGTDTRKYIRVGIAEAVNNVTVWYGDVQVTNGDVFPTDDEVDNILYLGLTFKADDGYEFNELSSLDALVNLNSSGGLVKDFQGVTVPTTEFSRVFGLIPRSGGTQNAISIRNLSVYLIEDEPTPIEAVPTFVNLYIPTPDEFNAITSYTILNLEGGTSSPDGIAKFITNTYYYPFPINPEFISDNKIPVMIGDRMLPTTSNYINSIINRVTLGSIVVPKKYNNVYDYQLTDVYLTIPYLSRYKLEVDYVVGHELTIEYVSIMNSGDTTVNIYSSASGGIIDSINIKVGYKVPYLQKDFVGSDSLTPVFNDVDNIMVEVIRNTPYNNNSELGAIIKEYGLLGNYTGFISVDRVELDIVSTGDEKRLIENALRQGVFINE